MSDTRPRDLRPLPKAHLHVHLEGAMRPSTLRELAGVHGVAVPPMPTTYGSFADFQDLYVAARLVLRRPHDLERLVAEVVEDAAGDGAVWIEPAVHLADHRTLGTDAEVLELLLDAAARASRSTGVGVGWLITADRSRAPELAVEQAEVAATGAGRGVVAFGLANDETAAPPERFATAFAIATEAGLISAPHAGEHCGPASVRGALDALVAHRVQHGVRCAEDPALVQRLAREKVCLDVCPTSNLALSVVDRLEAHPLRALVAAGVPCSINADDPLLFGTGLLAEYERCRRELGLDDRELARCALASIEHSGAPETERDAAAVGVARWLHGTGKSTVASPG